MANELVTIFDDVKSWFGKVFKNAPKDTAVALSILNEAAPLFEAAIVIEDPAVAVIVDPIITIVQADLGTVSKMLSTGQITGISSFLTAITSNFKALLTAAKVTNPTSVAKANAFLGLIDGLVAQFAGQ